MSNRKTFVKDVYKSFSIEEGEIHILKSVSFDIPSKNITVIVGPSGSGKTTLINILAGILNSDSGSVQLLGKNINEMNEEEIIDLRKREVGFIFQNSFLIPTLTVAENVSIPLIVSGKNPSEIKTNVEEILRKVGLEGRENEIPTRLSGGQQQRVAIARALVHKPKLIICDEPTASLDYENAKRVMSVLVDTAKNLGETVIIVTHDERVINEYADRVVMLEEGTVKKITQIER